MTIRPIYLVSVTPAEAPGIIHLPILETQWHSPAIELDAYDGIILTSKNGIEALERIDPAWKRLPVLCVGKATRKRAAELGAHILATGDGYGHELYALILSNYPKMRWLYARPSTVASDFASRLREAGIIVDEAVVYDTVCRAETVDIELPENAVLIFTSPSALACFRRRFSILPAHTLVVIGRTTAQNVEHHDLHIAPEPTVVSCIALANRLAKETQ